MGREGVPFQESKVVHGRTMQRVLRTAPDKRPKSDVDLCMLACTADELQKDELGAEIL